MPVRKFIVAIVDNDPRLLESLGDLLEFGGIFARPFRSARSLLEDNVALSELDCLIADIGMPVIDGSELQKLVKQVRPELPVILMTGHPESRRPAAGNWPGQSDPSQAVRCPDLAGRDRPGLA